MAAMPARLREIYTERGLVGVLSAVGRFFYWNAGLRWAEYQLRYRASDETITKRIDGYQATFGVTSRAEFIRIDSLMGEEAVLRDLLAMLDEGSVFFDVGSNVGLYACFASRRIGDAGSVVAFEPHPTNVSRLRENARLNGAAIDVQRLALTDASGTATMTEASDAAGEGEHAIDTEGGTLEVDTERLDDLIGSSLPSPDVMKVDVEGGELGVLEGMSGLEPSSYPDVLYCEVHPEKLPPGGETAVDETLSEYGYSVEVLLDQQREYMVKATRTED